MRVKLVRVNNQRRLRLARNLRRMGWPFWAIRQACRLSPAGVERALREEARGIWGQHSGAVSREMARAEQVLA